MTKRIAESTFYGEEDTETGVRCLFLCTTKYNASVLRLVADALPDWDCWFSPFYSTENTAYRLAWNLGFIQRTPLNTDYLKKVIQGMEELDLKLDVGAKGSYDIIVLGNDIFVPQDLRARRPKVLVQEGWVWPHGWRRWLCKRTSLPGWFAGSNGSGLSNTYDYFCVASQGYKELFVRSGIKDHRIVVTGLPTLDAVERDFAPLMDNTEKLKFVLVTTHPGREYFDGENRRKLLAQARLIAHGRPIVVKLHPHENHIRAIREVSAWLPEATVVVEGDTTQLIANCSDLLTTYSTTIFYALLLGKRVYCSYPTSEIIKLLPEQNGQAAQHIAKVCHLALMKSIRLRDSVRK